MKKNINNLNIPKILFKEKKNILNQSFSTINNNEKQNKKLKIFITLNKKILDKIIINPFQSLKELRKNICIPKINFNFMQNDFIIKKELEPKFSIQEILCKIKTKFFVYIKEKEKLITIIDENNKFSLKIGILENLNFLRKKLQINNDFFFIKNSSKIIQNEEKNILIKDCLINDSIYIQKIPKLNKYFSEICIIKKQEFSYIFSLNKTVTKHTFENNLFLYEIREKLNIKNNVFFLDKNEQKIELEKEDEIDIDSIAKKPENSNIKKIFLIENNLPISTANFLYEKNSLKIYKYPSQKLEIKDFIKCKNIIVIGETGSGKTTLINSFINFLMNIQITDDFRYVLIDEGQNQNQKESQTSNINSYYILPQNKDFPPIKIIDTPGFGDTRENFDESLLKKFKNYFDNENFIDLICFVIKSTNNRYTEFQKYIMSNILGLFGKDLVSNFLVLFTFCDGNQPNFIDSLKSTDNPFSKIIKEISDPWFLKFNNSAFFSEKSQKFQDLFWNMSYESF